LHVRPGQPRRLRRSARLCRGPGTCYEDIRGGGLLLGYRRDGFRRETLITTSDGQSCTLTPKSLRFAFSLPPRGEWSVTVDVAVASDMLGDTRSRRRADSGFETMKARGAAALEAWRTHLPTVTSDWVPLVETYRQGVADLAALRLPVNAPLGPFVPAAGLPWFMCLFGRDSIITSYEALPFAPELAEATLRTLALMQARTIDDFRDAQPGKIMHESRGGELTAFEERPHSPYYGSVDATPLFLILFRRVRAVVGRRSTRL